MPFKLVGERLEYGSSTWGKIRKSGSDGAFNFFFLEKSKSTGTFVCRLNRILVYIEKGSSTVGKCVNRSGTWVIESSGGSSLGSLHGSRIEKGSSGSTIAQLSDAKKDCDSSVPDHIAMSLYVLKKEGKI
jgi:hypothetical protein